jgi:hypothetical protein
MLSQQKAGCQHASHAAVVRFECAGHMHINTTITTEPWTSASTPRRRGFGPWLPPKTLLQNPQASHSTPPFVVLPSMLHTFTPKGNVCAPHSTPTKGAQATTTAHACAHNTTPAHTCAHNTAAALVCSAAAAYLRPPAPLYPSREPLW